MSSDHPDLSNPSSSYISHELRTPLNHIIGYSELLIEEIDDRKLVTLIAPLQQIRVNGRRIASMLSELLKPDAAQPPSLSLKAAHDDLCLIAGQVRQLSALVQKQIVPDQLNDLLPDLKKIDVAADQFVALLNRFIGS